LFSVKPGRKIPTHDHSCIATLCMTIARAEHLRETDCVAEVPVLCERVSVFGLLISGNREFLIKSGAEQVIRP
jgi:hypothetical protein